MPFKKLPQFTKKVADLPDTPNNQLTAQEVKEYFDAAPNEVRVALNALVDALQSETIGDSGAKNIGVTPLSGGSPDNVQEVLEWLKTQLDNATAGEIPDGSITLAKLAFNIKDEVLVPDETTNKKYKWVIENGEIYLEEV